MHELTRMCIQLAAGDKAENHLYTEFYGPLFTPNKEKFTDVLEIGIGAGASLRLWKEFFPKAQIWGIDNLHYQTSFNIKIPEEILEDNRMNIYLKDAYSDDQVAELKSTGTKFDLILDDGSHSPHDQLFVLNRYIDLLKESGILLIEDVGSLGNAYFIADNFKGDKGRLSIVDRRLNPTGRALEEPDKHKHISNWDEIIILYM